MYVMGTERTIKNLARYYGLLYDCSCEYVATSSIYGIMADVFVLNDTTYFCLHYDEIFDTIKREIDYVLV